MSAEMRHLPLASHVSVFSNAVRVGYADVGFTE